MCFTFKIYPYSLWHMLHTVEAKLSYEIDVLLNKI